VTHSSFAPRTAPHRAAPRQHQEGNACVCLPKPAIERKISLPELQTSHHVPPRRNNTKTPPRVKNIPARMGRNLLICEYDVRVVCREPSFCGSGLKQAREIPFPFTFAFAAADLTARAPRARQLQRPPLAQHDPRRIHCNCWRPFNPWKKGRVRGYFFLNVGQRGVFLDFLDSGC